MSRLVLICVQCRASRSELEQQDEHYCLQDSHGRNFSSI
jgi:hypothetical protein